MKLVTTRFKSGGLHEKHVANRLSKYSVLIREIFAWERL